MGRKPIYDSEMKPASTRLPLDTAKLLELFAEAGGKSVSEQIRIAVEEWVQNQDLDELIKAEERKQAAARKKLRQLALTGRKLKTQVTANRPQKV